jgi:hypothetical protein
MKLGAALALSVLVTGVLAGCFGGDDSSPATGAGGDGPGSSNQGGNQTGSPTGVPSGGPSNNQTGNQTGNGTGLPPEISFSAQPVNGSAPLNVSFNFTISDPEGDEVSWVLAFGDNATAQGVNLTAVLVHRYMVAGTYNATLNVTDATGQSKTAVLAIVVNAAAAAPTGPFHSFSGSWTASTPYECAVGFQSATSGVTWVGTTMPAGAGDRSFTAQFRATAPPAYFGISWYTSAGSYISDSDSSESPAMTTATVAGKVPATAGRANFFSCGGAQSSVTFTVL